MDVLIRGGTIVTMDPARHVMQGDVLVRGRTLGAVGRVDPGDMRPARVLDASNCAVIPGLVQGHVHLCQTLFRGLAERRALLPWLRERIWPLEAAHDARSLAASARLGVAEMLRAGTTTMLDMGTVHEQDAIFEVLRQSGIRGASGKAMMDRGRGLPRRLRERTRDSLHESERLCETWHGAEGNRLHYAFAPRFVLSCSDELMHRAADAAQAQDACIHTHAAENARERETVRKRLDRDDVAVLRDAGIEGPRAVLAHGVQLRRGEMRTLARAGTRVVHCPSANLKLASGLARVRELREAGVVVGVGADGAACNNRLDPWTQLREAALIGKVRSGDAATLAAPEALEMVTIDGARVMGLDDRVGSLEPGKRADVAVVRLDGLHAEPKHDVMTQLVYSCTASDVRHVVVDGRTVVREGELQTLDAERVRNEAARQATRIRKLADV